MNTIYLLIIINVVIWSAWLWRYRVQQYWLKKQLREQIKNLPDGRKFITIDNILTTIFRHAAARWRSHKDRQLLNKTSDDFTYGEIDALAFMMILDEARPQSGDVFFDLGSGSGKAVITAALAFDFRQSIGVELLPSLCELAEAYIQKTHDFFKTHPAPNMSAQLKRIHIINNDFFKVDLSDCNILFVNATCLSHELWHRLQQRLLYLPGGSRVIVTTQQLTLDAFELINERRSLMSWGLNTVRIYIKRV